MDYLQNHIWCSMSNWNDTHYGCRHLVSFSSYREHDKEDWQNLIDEKAERIVDEDIARMLSDINFRLKAEGLPTRAYSDDQCMVDVPNFKPHVLQWLHNNVKDRKDPDCEKGWCIGNAEYRKSDKTGITVFFHRKSDAMAFIKEFSKWKKPTHYCQYFTDVRKKLNLETLKYELS